MSLNNPITTPSQMPYPIVTDAPENEARNDFWWTVHYTGVIEERCKKLLPLRDKLLAFGGQEVCLPATEEDFENIMSRGQLFYGKGIKMRKGEPSHCHQNTCRLWLANKGLCQIATGYALSKDGIWRQHSWVVQPLTVKYRVWETTVPRAAYFGFVMDDTECKKICEECL